MGILMIHIYDRGEIPKNIIFGSHQMANTWKRLTYQQGWYVNKAFLIGMSSQVTYSTFNSLQNTIVSNWIIFLLIPFKCCEDKKAYSKKLMLLFWSHLKVEFRNLWGCSSCVIYDCKIGQYKQYIYWELTVTSGFSRNKS